MVYRYHNIPKILIFSAFMLLILVGHRLFAQDDLRSHPGSSVPPQDFQPLSAKSGWVLLKDRLYWTDDGGTNWANRTPTDLGDRRILATYFLNPRNGWLAAVGQSKSGQPTVSAAYSTDGGVSWNWSAADLLAQTGEVVWPAGAFLTFLDEWHGWLVIRRQSSSNFNSGILFSTADGGKTWVERQAESGGPVIFVNPQRGWMLGGPIDQEIYQTENGGYSWYKLRLPGLETGGRRQFYFPSFSNAGNGTLPVLLPAGEQSLLRYYHTTDFGQTWFPGTETTFAIEYGQNLPLAAAQDKVLASIPVPEYQRSNEKGYTFATRSVNAPDFQALVLSSPLIGWGLRAEQSCSSKQACREVFRLLKTADGGYTWSEMTIPTPGKISLPSLADHVFPGPNGLPLQPGLASVLPFTGQGFDACEIPTTSQLQTWMVDSPYGAVNLYIGGSCRACANQGLSAEFLKEASTQGWKFIPTWVGPQSSCYGSCGGSVISNNSAAAFQQGLVEADAALEEAIRLGLANADGSGTVIYYDLEAYSSNSTTCREAAKSFISGWSHRLQEKGSKAGLYGATCGTILSDFATIENVPDALWPAYWTYASYNSQASVWDLLCLDNALWPDQQRIRQYAGDHTESWGTVSLRLDSNVLDGLVADIQSLPGATLTPSPSPSPTATPSPTASTTPPPTASTTASPTATGTNTMTPSVTPSAAHTSTSVPSMTPTATQECTQVISNGGFENNSSWQIPSTIYPAAYSVTQVHSGNQALRAGIVALNDNIYSYSSAIQQIKVPLSGLQQTLHFWLYTQSVETSAVHLPGDLLSGDHAFAPLTSDLQMVLIRSSSGQILERLLVDRLNDRSWHAFSFDLSAYAGQTIQIYFGVYNNGTDGVTAMYVDDVALGSCALPNATATHTATPTPSSTAEATPTATPTTSPSAAATSTDLATATATETATATPSPSPSGTALATPLPTETATETVTTSPTPPSTPSSSPFLFFLPTMFNDVPFGISGRITDGNSSPLDGAAITIDSGGQTASDSSGLYSFNNLDPGAYVIKPEMVGYTFVPAERTITIPPSAGDQDFRAIPDIPPYP